MKSSLLPKDLDGTPAVACRDCGYLVFWGITVSGKRAPFNERPPHQNHLTTCTARKAAAKRLRAMKANGAKPAKALVSFGRHSDVTDQERQALEAWAREALEKP